MSRAIVPTMLRQMSMALALSRPNTRGTISVVAKPKPVIARPNTAEPDSSQVFSRRALSRSPAPRVLPRITPVAE